MSSPTKPLAGPLTGPNARRPAKLRIANPDSSDEDDARAAGQTARREELFQRARLSQDSQRASFSSTSSGGGGVGCGPSAPAAQQPQRQFQSPETVSPPVHAERSRSSPIPGSHPHDFSAGETNGGGGSSSSGYFGSQRSHSLLATSSSTAVSTSTTPGAERGRGPPSAVPPSLPPPPPPPPPPPNLTGRDLETWKHAAQAYTSPTATLASAGSSPLLRPLPRPLPHAQQQQQQQQISHSASHSTASSSSPSTSSLPPISPGSPLSLSMHFTSGSGAPSAAPSTTTADPSPSTRGPTPPPKSASWRTTGGPRPPSPLRTSAPAMPAAHAASPLGLSLATAAQAHPASGAVNGSRRAGPGSRSSQGDRRSIDGTDISTLTSWTTAGAPPPPAAQQHQHAQRQHQPPLYPQHAPVGRVTLLATTDGHKFASADVSGSTSSAAIREKIFTAVSRRLLPLHLRSAPFRLQVADAQCGPCPLQLEVPDDEQPAYHLRRHAMGGGPSPADAALDGDGLYQYCAEPGESIKGVLAVMSFEQSHPSVPFLPPPTSTGPSAGGGTSKSGRSDDYSSASGRYPRRPTSQAETASSMSDLNVLDEGGTMHAPAGGGSGGAYPTSSSETSISTTDMDQPSAGGTSTSSLKRKPHQRRSSHLFVGGSRRASSPSSAGSRRHDREGSTASSAASPTSPPLPLASPDSLGVDPNAHVRLGSVTPTRPASADRPTPAPAPPLPPLPPPPQPPTLHRRPPSMSPEEIRQMGSSESVDEQERILRAIQADRARDRQMVEDVIQRERAEEMAREWERRDREEEAERRRRQIQEDEETAMMEQRKEQELYKVRRPFPSPVRSSKGVR